MAGNNGRKRGELPRPRSLEERDKAKSLYESGATCRTISDELAVPASTIRVWALRDKWQKSEPQTAIVPQSEIEELIPDSLSACAEEYETNMATASVIVSRHVAQMPANEVVQKADRLKSFDGVARRALKIESEKPRCVIQLAVLASSPARHQKQLSEASETLTLDV
jgi:Phage terminase small subunit